MNPQSRQTIPDRVRAASAWVAPRARSVRIEEGGIDAYAAVLPDVAALPAPDPATSLVEAEREARIAFVVCLNAINFGSGWWPTIRKRPGHSGYFTIAAGLTDRFRQHGAWSPLELTHLEAADLAEALGQDPDHPLMAEYATSLGDVGEHLLAEHAGRFAALAQAAGGSAVGLTDLLAGWEAFADVSTYEGRPVPFFKRAQLAAAELNRAGLATLRDEDRLTAFADNLVPHVLRVDGLLRLDPELDDAIDAGALLRHGSPEEVELRACAVHAVELLATASGLSAATVDAALWHRGGDRRYKAVPRPRSRTTAY